MTRMNAKIFHRIVHNEVNGSSIHSYSGLKLNDSKVLDLMVMAKAARRERLKPSRFQHLLFIISSLFPLNYSPTRFFLDGKLIVQPKVI